jgi:hypothetical protein
MTFKHLDRIARCKRYRSSDVDLLTCDLVSVKLENAGERNSSLITVTSASPVSSALDKEYFPYKAIIWFELNTSAGPAKRPTSPRAGDTKKAPTSHIITDKKTKDNSETNRTIALDPNAKSVVGNTPASIPNSNKAITGSLQLPISLTRTAETEVPDTKSLGAQVRADPRVMTPRASVSFHPVISTKSGKIVLNITMRFLFKTVSHYFALRCLNLLCYCLPTRHLPISLPSFPLQFNSTTKNQLSVPEQSSTGIKGLDSSSLVVLRSIGMDQSLISRISSTPLPLPTNVPHAPKILKVNQLKEKISLKSEENSEQVMTSVTVETNGKTEGSDHDHDKNQEDNDSHVSEDVSVEDIAEDVEEGVHADFDDNISEDMDVDMDQGQDWQSCYADDPEDIYKDDPEDIYKDDDDDDDDDDARYSSTTEPPPNIDNSSTNRLWGNRKSVVNGIESDKTHSIDHTAASDQDENEKTLNSSAPFGTPWPGKSTITGLKGSTIVVPKKIDAIRVGLEYQAEVVPYSTDSDGLKSVDLSNEVHFIFFKTCV